MVVWKFPLTQAENEVKVPSGTKIVHVGLQVDTVTIWMEVPVSLRIETRRFQIFGTGHAIPDDATHRGTVMQGPMVWHVYELGSCDRS